MGKKVLAISTVNNENTGIDIVKYIASILVLMSHVGFWRTYSESIDQKICDT